MKNRLLALTLALLLGLTQQLGLLHVLSHALGTPSPRPTQEASADLPAAGGTGSAVQEADAEAADGLCHACLALAALGLGGLLPALPRWWARRGGNPRPGAPSASPARARHLRPYLARAPPALPAVI